MLVQKENKIGEVVARNFHTAQVFENFGLDFCCNGKKTISEACLEKGLDPDFVVKEVIKTEETNGTATHFDKWEADFLTDYIVNNHHYYVLTTIPTIEHHLQKVISKHGGRHPDLAKIEEIFLELKVELTNHMAKEEKMLFPYIKKMNIALKNTLEMPVPPFGTIENPVKVMEAEHEAAGALIAGINKLTGNFTPPEDACGTYRLLYSELKDFEKDLHMHIHLENNILFPKAVELEEKLKSTYSTL